LELLGELRDARCALLEGAREGPERFRARLPVATAPCLDAGVRDAGLFGPLAHAWCRGLEGLLCQHGSASFPRHPLTPNRTAYPYGYTHEGAAGPPAKMIRLPRVLHPATRPGARQPERSEDATTHTQAQDLEQAGRAVRRPRTPVRARQPDLPGRTHRPRRLEE